jgi:hypothetical protein
MNDDPARRRRVDRHSPQVPARDRLAAGARDATLGLGGTLATFNIKHYAVITGLSTLQPY